MMNPMQRLECLPISRRDLLRRAGMGFGALGLANLLAADRSLTAAPLHTSPLAPRQPHFPGKAKRVIHLFMNGGPSHVDSFDPKPAFVGSLVVAAAGTTV